MRKKLFAVIMSAMMMITFMPTMAFAVDNPGVKVKWEKDYSAINVTYGDSTWKLATAKTFSSADGSVKVVVSDDEVNAYTDSAMPSAVKDFLKSDDDVVAHYFDLKDAVLMYGKTASATTEYGGENPTNVLPATFNKNEFYSLFWGPEYDGSDWDWNEAGTYYVTGIKLFGHDADGKKTAESKVLKRHTGMKNWSFEFNRPDDFDGDSYAEQKFTVPVEFESDDFVDLTSPKYVNEYDLIGELSKELIVSKSAPKADNDAEFFADKVNTRTYDTWLATGVADFSDSDWAYYNVKQYDGKEHKIVMNAVEGLTVTYQEYNKKTGKFDDVETPTYKDAGMHKFRAFVKDGSTFKDDPYVYNVQVYVNPLEIEFGWDSNGEIYDGIKYTPADLLEWTYLSGGTDDELKAFIKENKKMLDTYVSDYFTLTATPQAMDATKVDVKMELKSDEDIKAADKKYKELFGENIYIDQPTSSDYTATYNVVPVTGNELAACNSSKTFHIKNAKALKKTKTFTMKNDYVKIGSASYFKKSGNSKIKVAKNGKVTVKKGLKKGTYKVKIKVTAAGVTVPDTKTLTIKIKK